MTMLTTTSKKTPLNLYSSAVVFPLSLLRHFVVAACVADAVTIELGIETSVASVAAAVLLSSTAATKTMAMREIMPTEFALGEEDQDLVIEVVRTMVMVSLISEFRAKHLQEWISKKMMKKTTE